MAVKPLKELLKEADTFSRSLGLNKVASSQAAPDEISRLAEELLGANDLAVHDDGLEKTAMALNRAEALLQIQTLRKLATFRERALKDGHTEEQVNEAVEKIAAKKLHENLAILTAVDGIAIPVGKDKNSLEKKKVPAREVGQAPLEVNLTRSLGYGT